MDSTKAKITTAGEFNSGNNFSSPEKQRGDSVPTRSGVKQRVGRMVTQRLIPNGIETVTSIPNGNPSGTR